MKQCARCEHYKELHEFSPISKNQNRTIRNQGVKGWCRQCHNEASKEWHRERVKAMTPEELEARRIKSRDRHRKEAAAKRAEPTWTVDQLRAYIKGL